MTSLPQSLQTLVEKFRDNLESYKHSSYNETQLRREFLDKFIKILGWDVDNEEGVHESFKEVIHEDRLRVGTSTKAPDYCVQIGGKKLFYIEAKKPSVKIIDDADAAFQVRRYGWTAQMPVCLLTDFEEFSVYNTGIKPKDTDKSSAARFFYCRYDELDKKNPQYPEHESNWSFLESLFSKNAVIHGSLEKIKSRDKKGTQEVDKEFLREIEEWRELLTNNLVLRNELAERELNFAVQKIIDRIIFIRICEDRGIEAKNTLQNIAKNNDIYSALTNLFQIADDKYNSGLFHFKKEKDFEDTLDTLTLKLKIDDKPLRSIIKSLYDPAPYIFSVMPADILGSIYERFLGKVIRITSAHRAKIEEKPEVRKAGGVYYTPQYIVSYIIENTIGKQLADRTPKTLKGFRILDPACGSGSFLISAYQFLLDWHLKEYDKNADFYCKQKALVKTSADSYKLSIRERKRILTEHIFGVDIDIQAVEVTKLSLLLKALEGLQEQEIQAQLFHERILPNLGNNIKCGNSLIGTDFYAQMSLNFSDEEQLKINCFDWKKEYPTAFKDGGFDVVIGNPPYVKEYTSRETFERVKKSYLSKYYQGKMDLWYFFVCHGIDILKTNGLLSFIVPNNWVTNAGASILRNKVLTDTTIKNIVDFGAHMVFENASIQTMILILEKQEQESYCFDYRKLDLQKPNIIYAQKLLEKEPEHGLKYIEPTVTSSNLKDKFLVFGDNKTENLLNKIQSKANFILDARNEITNGIHPHYDFVSKQVSESSNGKFVKGQGIFGLSHKEKEELHLSQEERKMIKPYYNTAEQLGKYYGDNKNELWIIYTTSDFKNPIKMKNYPNLKKHLDQFKNIITSDNKPYGLHRSRDEKFFIGEKIISLRKCAKPTFTFTDFDCYASAAFYIIKTDRINQKYLTAILNSKLIAFWLKHRGKMQGNIYQIDKEPILEIPIFNTSDKAKHDELVSLVDKMLELKKKEAAELNPQRKTVITRQIAAVDEAIDAVVYGLYGVEVEEVENGEI